MASKDKKNSSATKHPTKNIKQGAISIGDVSNSTINISAGNNNASKQQGSLFQPQARPAVAQWLVPAILGLVGVFVLLFGTIYGVNKPIHATQTREAVLTSIATQMPMTSTDTLFPTATLTFTRTYTPTLMFRVLLQEDFLDNHNGWSLATPGPGGTEAKIVGGKYTHTISCPSYLLRDCYEYIGVPNVNPDNFRFDINLAILYSTSPEVEVQIQFRWGESYYYAADFSNSGACKLQMYLNNALDSISEVVQACAPMGDQGMTNRIGVLANGSSFALYLNGEPLLAAEDGNIKRNGPIRIILKVARGGDATIVFDNLVITGLP